MNLTRRILEGIHEVELQVTPEFQEKWPVPQLWDKVAVAPDPKGNTRARVVYRWPDATIATGLEVIFKPGEAELNVWAPGSTIKPGSWQAAMSSIKKSYGHHYPEGIYVYVEGGGAPHADALVSEIIASEAVKAHETIDDKEPGEEPVVDHFLGYEAKPASEQPEIPGPTGETGPTWGVPLTDDVKVMVSSRPWMHLTHPNADVTESNPVMVLTKSIPIDVAVQDKKRDVQGRFEGLEFQVLWSPKLEAWRVWPDEGQSSDDFSNYVGYLIHRIEEIIDVAEDT